MQIGDMNVEQAILNLELHLGTLLKTVSYIYEHNENIKFPSASDVGKFRSETLDQIKQQYPNNDFSRF